MPRLSVCVDERVLDSIRVTAKIAGSSVSGRARKKLTHVLEKTRPEGYFELPGSLAGLDLERPVQPQLRDDVPTELL